MQTQILERKRTHPNRQLLFHRTSSPTQLEHELLTLINKRIVTLGSYWHQKEMIGVGVWYCTKQLERNSSTESKEERPPAKKVDLKTVRSARAINKICVSEYYHT